MIQAGPPSPQPASLPQPSAAREAAGERLLFAQPETQPRIRGAAGVGFLAHVIFITLVLFISRLVPETVYQAILPDKLPSLVWLAVPGPGGGGGGGGNKSPDPPKKVELPKPEKTNPPVILPKPEPPKPEEPPPTPIPAQTPDPPPVVAPGVIEAPQAVATSQGTGVGGGGGTGEGTGVGQGQGAGLGAGTDRGVGGGAYRPGNGVTIPRAIRTVSPQYTAEAMRARIQGVVRVECVVLPDGTVGRIEVINSLDSVFGLDQEAIKAARQWRFAPGTRFGEPVAVLVTIELAFSVR